MEKANYENIVKKMSALLKDCEAHPEFARSIADLSVDVNDLMIVTVDLKKRVEALERRSKPLEQSKLTLPKEVWNFISAVDFCRGDYGDGCSACPYSVLGCCTVVLAERAEELLKKYSYEVTK